MLPSLLSWSQIFLKMSPFCSSWSELQANSSYESILYAFFMHMQIFNGKLTVHVVLLTVPPQAHGNKGQQDEHHHCQNTAHDQVEQASGGAGGIWRMGARWGDGALAGGSCSLACCSRGGEGA